VITSIWVLGFGIAAPEFYSTQAVPFDHREHQYLDCREQVSELTGQVYTIFLFMFTFLMPMLALVFVYSRICMHLLNKAQTPGNPDTARDQATVNKKMKVSGISLR